jgi:general secretion pathway protein A
MRALMGQCQRKALVDPESGQPLADDLSFLDDLDRGLDVSVPAQPRTRADARPHSETASSITSRQRPLLDLFPTTSAEGPASPDGTALPPPRHHPWALGSSRPRPDAPLAALSYEGFYGLNEAPFSLASDPKFLYHSTSHDRAAQDVLSAIVRRDSIIVLTGELGSGKTTLCRAVGEQIDRRTFTAFVADPFIGIEDLLKSVLVDFGVISRADLAGGRLVDATQSELMIALKEFLLSLVPLNGFAVVFIDEAQNLSPEMLEHVRGIADIGGDKRLIQFVIVAQPGLLKTLRRPELNRFAERVSIRCELGPLAEDEISAYVFHRLSVAGGRPSLVEFDDDALTLIYDLTHGLPRLVNRLCDRVLAIGYDQSESLIDAAMVEAAARDVGLIVAEAPSAKMMRIGLGAAVLVVLTLVGAGAATIVFRPQIRRTVAQWQALPPPPPPPALAVVGPIEPVPGPGPAVQAPGPPSPKP